MCCVSGRGREDLAPLCRLSSAETATPNTEARGPAPTSTPAAASPSSSSGCYILRAAPVLVYGFFQGSSPQADLVSARHTFIPRDAKPGWNAASEWIHHLWITLLAHRDFRMADPGAYERTMDIVCRHGTRLSDKRTRPVYNVGECRTRLHQGLA